MSVKMDKTEIGISCPACGCVRQVRTQSRAQTPPPRGAKTVYTYLQTACPACGAEAEHLVFLEPGWTVLDGNRQTIACSCGGTLFQTPAPKGGEQIEHGTVVSFHEVVCTTCQKESLVFIFSGTNVLTDQERQEVLAAEAS